MKKIIKALLTICLICSVFTVTNVSAASVGTITGVKNANTGLKVTWTRDRSKTGYYIYRKVGTGAWKRVKKITKNATLSWVDTNTNNGTKYTYKVRSYKGTKITANTKTKYTYKVNRPTINTLTSTMPGEIKMVSSVNKKATGYRVQLSKNSDMSKETLKYINGTSINQTIGNLTPGAKYYVRIQAFKTVNGTKYYSAYSVKKTITVKASSDYYFVQGETQLKATKGASDYILAPYNAKVRVVKNVEAGPKGNWYQVKYKGKASRQATSGTKKMEQLTVDGTYYIWQAAGVSRFKTTASSFKYTNSNAIVQAILDEATRIYHTNTEYAKNGTVASGELTENGNYAYDCTGFVRTVMMNVMNKENPCYYLPKTTLVFDELTTLYNGGYENQLDVNVVCKGTWDKTKVKPGDIIFFHEGSKTSADCPITQCTHVGIYLGNNEFMHSEQTFDGVIISPMVGRFVDEFLSAKRMTPVTSVPADQKAVMNGYAKLFSFCDKDTQAENVVSEVKAGEEVTIKYIVYLEWLEKNGSSMTWDWAYVETADGRAGCVWHPQAKDIFTLVTEDPEGPTIDPTDPTVPEDPISDPDSGEE